MLSVPKLLGLGSKLRVSLVGLLWRCGEVSICLASRDRPASKYKADHKQLMDLLRILLDFGSYYGFFLFLKSVFSFLRWLHMSKSLRDQLLGAWELIEYCAYMPDNESDKKYPMGPEAQGIIMYTSDGYMSAQLLTPGQKKFEAPGSEAQLAEMGKRYVGYTGQFYLDEAGDAQGPILLHHMRTANLPYLLGDTQRRLVKIVEEEDGRYLHLSLGDTMKVFGEDRMVKVRWKRLPDNHGA